MLKDYHRTQPETWNLKPGAWNLYQMEDTHHEKTQFIADNRI
jgi:hypothetical protein